MSAVPQEKTTAALAEWASAFRLDQAPDVVVDRMKALVLDFLRVVAVGARLPWSQSARRVALALGGKAASTVLLTGDRLDAARAAFVNGAYAHACDLDDTHVGSMHHPGASVLPAALAVAEQSNADGRAFLEAAICGYEASLRIGLAVQPSMFHRGFMSTPTCGALGAALAVGKLLGFGADNFAGALGVASSYAGGLAQFYKSGSAVKRINGAKAAESGVMAALLTQSGMGGPRDILEGESGFFRAFADRHDATQVTGDLGTGYRLMQVSTKVHAGAGRLQAAVDAGLALGARHALRPETIGAVVVGIPQVIAGKLTQADPPDLQSAQLSVPFAVAIGLTLGRTRGPSAALRREDYEAALASPPIRALSTRVRCVVDAEVEAGTTAEEVPAWVQAELEGGAVVTERVPHPRGSPSRRMAWEELQSLFADSVGDAIDDERLQEVMQLVSALDTGVQVNAITKAYQARPGWVQ
ncbi:MAG: MmgE/PrpD family protein [Rhodospirillaceae bacterium]